MSSSDFIDGDYSASSDLLEVMPGHFEIGKFPLNKETSYSVFSNIAPFGNDVVPLETFLMIQANKTFIENVFGFNNSRSFSFIRLVATNEDRDKYIAITPFGFVGWLTLEDFTIINYHEAKRTIH